MTYFAVITLLMTVPFSVIVLYVCLSVQDTHLETRRLLPYAAVLGTLLSIFRILPIPFGLHTLVYILLLILSLYRLARGRLSMIILSALLTSVLAAVGEGLVSMPILTVLNVSLDQLHTDPWTALLAGWLGNSLIVAVAGYFALRRRSVERRASR